MSNKQLTVKTKQHYVTAAEGFKPEIPETAVLEKHRVPLEDGEYFISFSGFFQSNKLKSRIGLATFKDLGLIYRDGSKDHWMPTTAGKAFFVQKPGSPNHWGVYTGELEDLIAAYSDRFINIYDAYVSGDITLNTRVSPTVKLPVPDDTREALRVYMAKHGFKDFGPAIDRLLIYERKHNI